MNKKKFWTDLTSLILLVFLFGGMLLNLILPDRSFSDMENRVLAQFPEFTWEKFITGKYTKDLETYMSDQFFARDAWVGLQAFSQQLLGRGENNGVYFAGDRLLEQFKAPNPDYIDKAFAALEKLPGVVKVPTVFGLIPTATWLYQSDLPYGAPTYDQGILLDKAQQLDFYADLTEVFVTHRDEYIFYNTDHHWTTLGAYYAYTVLARQLGLEPLSLEQLGDKAELDSPFYGTTYSTAGVRWGYEDRVHYYPALDLDFRYTEDGMNWTDTRLYDLTKADAKDQYAIFTGGNYPLGIVTNPEAEGTLLLIKDSYSNALLPFLAQHYNQIIVMDPRYNHTFLSLVMKDYPDIDACLCLYQTGNLTQDTNLAMIVR